ncbi:nitroreductase [soil metagenome]
MNVIEAIRARRSVKRFIDRPPTREQIETLLDTAVLAPNHRGTEPWRFYVLGPEARHAYGLALGERRARKLDDLDRAREVRDRTATEHRELPCMIAVAMTTSDNPEVREEDYAATMMGVQNMALAAVELGLGTHIRTGAVMDDPAARAAAGVAAGERIIALVNVGTAAEVPPGRQRTPAAGHTTWMP